MDITKRNLPAELFSLAIEAAPTGMLMVDPTGKIAWVNVQVERLFGYGREELVGQAAEILIPPRFRGQHLLSAGALHRDPSEAPLTGEGRELYGLRKDGSEVRIEARPNPLRTTAGEFVLHSIVDTRERKRSEREQEDLTRKLQRLTASLIEAQEAERARIARELHDDISQQVASLSISLSGLKGRVDSLPGGEQLRGDVSSLQQRALALAEDIRHLSHDLHPTVLQHAGLAANLDAFCAQLRTRHSLDVTFVAQGDFGSIDSHAALSLYRVAQEALGNVVRHAEAGHADVRLLNTGQALELTVADDGRGFDVVTTRQSGKGLGLVSIAERAKLAGGTSDIVTEPNKGTRVHVQIPARSHAKTDD
jgi:PAS domain S-box-containing protein